MTSDTPATRLATRLLFFVAGFVVACWAPLVPFAKQRLGVDDGVLGLLLFAAGAGSLPAMLLTGALCARLGIRSIVTVSGTALLSILPILSIAGTTASLGLAMLAFGGALGALDVSMNVHAVEVERAAQRPLMSGFHSLFSVGGLAGSGLMTVLLTAGISPLYGTLACAGLGALAIAMALPRLAVTATREGGPHFAVPHGSILLLAGLAAIMFLVEGAILDWTAVLITGKGFVEIAKGGLGYLLFAVAMTVGRLAGDRAAAELGDKRILEWGGFLAISGFVMLLVAPAYVAVGGLVLMGLGASNIVPALFRRAGTQREMPVGLAVAAISTAGYAGHLTGPAVVGFVSRYFGLAASFWMLALMVCLVPLAARRVVRAARG